MSNVSFIAEEGNYKIEEEKWALSIESVKSVSVKKSNRCSMSLSIDKPLNQKIVEENKVKLKNKKLREFVFYTEKDLKKFIYVIRRLYFNLKKSYIVVNLA